MHLFSPGAKLFIRYPCKELWPDRRNKSCQIMTDRGPSCPPTSRLTFHASPVESTTRTLSPACQSRCPGTPAARRWSWPTTGWKTPTERRLQGDTGKHTVGGSGGGKLTNLRGGCRRLMSTKYLSSSKSLAVWTRCRMGPMQ